jgi:hypothetical protein
VVIITWHRTEERRLGQQPVSLTNQKLINDFRICVLRINPYIYLMKKTQSNSPKFQVSSAPADLKGMDRKDGQQVNNRPKPEMGLKKMMSENKAGNYRGGY